MAYQRGSLKKVKTKKGWIWVLRYRINGAEQTPLVVGLVDDVPTEDEASLEADRLGLRVRINCGVPQGGRMKYCELAEYYLKVEFDPEVTASPKSENTKPILDHYVRDFLIAQWGDQIAENIEPLEIQKWFDALHNKKEYGWTTVSDSGHHEPNLQDRDHPQEGHEESGGRASDQHQNHLQGDQDHSGSDAPNPALCDGEHAALHSGVFGGSDGASEFGSALAPLG